MEEVEADLIDFRQHFNRMAQARFGAARQVNLRDVAGNDRLRVKADTGQEHFHLFNGRVLAFVENDKRIVQRTAAHIGQRRDFNHVALNQLFDFLEAEHLEQRVVQGPQVRIDFLAQIAGQEAQFFAGLNRRTGQKNTADLLALQRVYRGGDRQVGFPGPGRTDAEGNVVVKNIGDVLRLIRRTRFNHAALGFDIDGLTVVRHAFGALLQHAGFFDRQMNLFRFNILNFAAHRRGIDVQTAQDIRRSGDANRPTGQFKVVVTTVNLDAEAAFQLFNVVIKRAAQAQQTGVVRGLKGDFASVCIQAVPLIHR